MFLRLSLAFILAFGFSQISEAQSPSEFPDTPPEFIKELGVFMTASKQSALEDVFKAFSKKFNNGGYTPEEFTVIHQTCNGMLSRRMRAGEFFKPYLESLLVVKNGEKGADNFIAWHQVLNQMMEDIESRKTKYFKAFMKFSQPFYELNAIKYSKSGVKWFAEATDFKLKYEEKIPSIEYDKVTLHAVRKGDSISIIETSGSFLLLENIWKGKGGKVTWERFKDLEEEVYCSFEDYSINISKPLYEVNPVKIHYPQLFPNGDIVGRFQDKIMVRNKATEGSYPRFISQDSVLNIENIGGGVRYQGGFKLQGTTVHGYGSPDNKAKIAIYDEENNKTFRGASELFVIRKGERMVGEGVESVLYFGQDSIYHPSVNFKFEIPKEELTLSRGKRGSDRNPFFNSQHQFNIDVNSVKWLMAGDSLILGERSVSFASTNKKVTFESLNFFLASDYDRLQNISSTNPLATIKIYSEREGTRFLSANNLAKFINPKFNASSIQSLLYDLVSKGFVNYDSNKQIVEVKEKVFHYANASQKKVDYDILRVVSVTDSTNAVMNMKDGSIDTRGVANIQFSGPQNVAVKPFLGELTMKTNRNLDFDGKLFAGYSQMEGKDFSFIYDQNHIETDSVRYMDLFIPTDAVSDETGDTIALSISSRLEHLSGVLLIDAPSNMSGQEDIPMFPAFESKENSYVFYDYKETLGGVYSRDSFFFKLDPFSFNSLDHFTREDVHFDGVMVSADIFPEFKETIVLQEEDESLGFQTETPADGLPNYQGKGTFTGEIDLSNKGFLAKGNVKYLGANIDSEDIIYRPKKMTASAEKFDLAEDRTGPVEVPQTLGLDVSIDWRPYVDSMYVKTKEKPFDLFKENNHTLAGMVILTPDGLKGVGNFKWDKGVLQSKLMSFGAFSTKADTSNLQILAFGSDALAFDTKNVNAELDFDAQKGFVKANDENHVTTMPYNQYTTSLDEFVWDMKEETVTFQNEGGKLGRFTSIHPDQDSLIFDGATAFYDLKNNELKIGGVPYIQSCDAYIYTETGDVEIRPGGVMSKFKNAKIVADTLSKYHVINRANVTVKGRKEYRASGFYEYNIGDRKQEIEFKDIVGTRVGKGARSKKKAVTRATGTVSTDDRFYIDRKTEFRGKISLSAENINLKFDGFAKIDSPVLPKANWFSLSCEADKNNMIIEYNNPKNYDGGPLVTGVYLSKETARVYPAVMDVLYFRKDRPLFVAKGEKLGLFKYNRVNDEFVFGDSLRVASGSPYGDLMTVNNKTGEVFARGTLNIGTGLKYMSLTTAGHVKTQLDQENSSTELGPAEVETEVMVMAGVDMKIPDKLLKILITDLQASSFDARPIDYLKHGTFFEDALATFIPTAKNLKSEISEMKSSGLDLDNKFNKFPFLFSYLPMGWNSEYQSFVNTKLEVGLASINGVPINRMLKCHVEFKMPSNEDDRVYMYIQSPSEDWYFFGYKQGILSMVSSNTKFNDALLGMKTKELTFKQKDGGVYEIQAVDPNSALLFVNRIKASRTQK